MWDVVNKDYDNRDKSIPESTVMTREAIRKIRALLAGQVQERLYVVNVGEQVEILTKLEAETKYPINIDNIAPLRVGGYMQVMGDSIPRAISVMRIK